MFMGTQLTIYTSYLLLTVVFMGTLQVHLSYYSLCYTRTCIIRVNNRVVSCAEHHPSGAL